jgi:hypothetical protein
VFTFTLANLPAIPAAETLKTIHAHLLRLNAPAVANHLAATAGAMMAPIRAVQARLDAVRGPILNVGGNRRWR